ncbi:MAG: DUF2330 domain-containing protein [Polyangiaceae bacterium]
MTSLPSGVRRATPASLACVLSCAVLVGAPDDAMACAPVGPRGVPIEMVEEEALLVWDAATQTEHFIRRAAFATSARHFGFLVPTPSAPELAEVDGAVFRGLEALLEPKVVERDGPLRPEFGCMALRVVGSKAVQSAVPSAAAPEVSVLATTKVAGYEATVVEANDAGLLAKWLVDRGYDTRPSLRTWLEPYVASQWKLTAFKYIGEEGAPSPLRGTPSVRMSFRTSAPFFPYREPKEPSKETAPPTRSLRVFVLTTEGRMDAAIGRGSSPLPFAGKLDMSTPVTPAASVAAALPGAVPGSMWLSVFTDKSIQRSASDELYFAKSANTEPVPVPPIVVERPRTFLVPMDLLGGALAMGLGILALVMRRGTSKSR